MNQLIDRPGQDPGSPAVNPLPAVHVAPEQSELCVPQSDVRLLCIGAYLLMWAVVICGCGSGKPAWERVHPISGTLRFGGQPIAGAMLVFYPKDPSVPESVRPIGKTDASGNFDIGTYSVDDGIPTGDFDVTVTWNPLVDVGAGPAPGPNQLPIRYSNRQTSQLTVSISSDDSELKTIELTP